LLFGTDRAGRTAWQSASAYGKLELLRKIWEFAEEKQTNVEVKIKLLLGTDSEGMTAWHYAAAYGSLDLLHKIWKCAEEKLKTGEVKS